MSIQKLLNGGWMYDWDEKFESVSDGFETSVYYVTKTTSPVGSKEPITSYLSFLSDFLPLAFITEPESVVYFGSKNDAERMARNLSSIATVHHKIINREVEINE